MFRSDQYTVATELNYIPVSGVVAEDVIKVTRSGKDIRITEFDSSPVNTDIYSFQWYGISTEITLPVNMYIITVFNSVIGGVQRIVKYEIGSVVGRDYTFTFTNGTNIASYTSKLGDVTEDIRDALITALEAVSWGFTITVTPISTNQIYIEIDGTGDFGYYIGRATYKTGYYCTINSEDYLIYYDDDFSAYPTLPGINASYDFTDLTLMDDGIEAYLDDPTTTNTFSETLEGVSAISSIPGEDTVPNQFCVIENTEQRVYFWETLGFGENIKIYQK